MCVGGEIYPARRTSWADVRPKRRRLQPKAAIKQKTTRHPGGSVVPLDFVVGQQFGLLQQQPPLAGGKAAELRQQLALVVRHRGFVTQQMLTPK